MNRSSFVVCPKCGCGVAVFEEGQVKCPDCAQKMSKPENVELRFVRNLDFHAKAICLYWINEIHVDEKYRHHPAIGELIAHEMKHYRIISKMLATNSEAKRWFLELYNDLWDIFDVYRLQLLYFKTELLTELLLGLIGALLLYTIFSLS